MTNKSKNKSKIIEVKEAPKIPLSRFGGQKTSFFSSTKSFVPKGNPGAKFNQATFHTQHKGGPSGGK